MILFSTSYHVKFAKLSVLWRRSSILDLKPPNIVPCPFCMMSEEIDGISSDTNKALSNKHAPPENNSPHCTFVPSVPRYSHKRLRSLVEFHSRVSLHNCHDIKSYSTFIYYRLDILSGLHITTHT